ncbi:MAG: SRPBCC domain-containing protein [Bryobacterales bacterium]|nr:SRPBCC domain-containing protein [Bryobacterales bacterium]
MQVKYQSDFAVDESTANKETGQGLEAWFKDLDSQGGVAAGRRPLLDYLFRERKVNAWWTTTLMVEYEAARGVTEKDGRPNGYNICVTKSVAASPDVVFAAFGGGAWLGEGATCDFKEGGRFTDAHGHAGTFKKIAAPKTLRFTIEGEGHSPSELVEIKLAPAGAKTGITLNHNRCPNRAVADGMRAAWGEVLIRIKEELE